MNDLNLTNLYNKHIMPTYKPANIVITSGNGCYVYDTDGNSYLDFIAGIAVNNLGYNHPALTKAICEQSQDLIHISNLFINKEQVMLAQRLTGIFNGGKVFFSNSGAEAVEGAIKLARKYAKKNLGREKFEIITMHKSFHGRTLAAITATGQAKYQQDLEPLVPGFKHATFGDLESIKGQLTENTCAVMIEPVQGEGGINIASESFWKGLADLCKKNNLLLILDEVQTGIGRTGKFFAHEHYGITPDIVTLAKGLGGGVPIGAILARDNIAAAFSPGDHASTFGGNPLACRAALAVIETIENEGLLDNVRQLEKVMKTVGEELTAKFSFIKEVRGRGLMWGIELDESINCPDIITAARDKGLLLNCVGTHIIRIAPPLIITKDQLKEGLATLEEIFKLQ